MSGLFGGFLGVVNYVEGFTLFLLIGSKAMTESKKARWIRIASGSIVVRLLASVLLSLFDCGDLDCVGDHVGSSIILTMVISVLLEFIGCITGN